MLTACFAAGVAFGRGGERSSTRRSSSPTCASGSRVHRGHTDQGLLHDDWNLGLVYEVLRFDPADSQRQRGISWSRPRRALRRCCAASPASATDNLTAHERRTHAFGDKPTAAQFRDAIEGIRFQLGQADRFHEGLIRAQAYEADISRILAERGVPPEIGALPHVESSFNPAAYSRVGAAGLWQFMPGTARRYMRVDSVVDQRLDPYSATEAAANLMLYNYRLLGTWPLAVTAYNHGPGGLWRAQDDLGTNDIAVIVKRFQGATFGFASRNFYVAFLAALEVDRNAEKYFGQLTRLPEAPSTFGLCPTVMGTWRTWAHCSVESRAAPAGLESGRLCRAATPCACRFTNPRWPLPGSPAGNGASSRREMTGAPDARGKPWRRAATPAFPNRLLAANAWATPGVGARRYRAHPMPALVLRYPVR